jgi:hypothetical protein
MAVASTHSPLVQVVTQHQTNTDVGTWIWAAAITNDKVTFKWKRRGQVCGSHWQSQHWGSGSRKFVSSRPAWLYNETLPQKKKKQKEKTEGRTGFWE